jgi:putative DNA methylase
MLMALLLPDPGDTACPSDFKQTARALLPGVMGQAGDGDSELRAKLFDFIVAFSSVSNASKDIYLDISRKLVTAAHGDVPLVVDPFAGGGAIPLEWLRIGCDTFASDYMLAAD